MHSPVPQLPLEDIYYPLEWWDHVAQPGMVIFQVNMPRTTNRTVLLIRIPFTCDMHKGRKVHIQLQSEKSTY